MSAFFEFSVNFDARNNVETQIAELRPPFAFYSFRRQRAAFYARPPVTKARLSVAENKRPVPCRALFRRAVIKRKVRRITEFVITVAIARPARFVARFEKLNLPGSFRADEQHLRFFE